eukprot:5773520-Prymnesium_polylepis.1
MACEVIKISFLAFRAKCCCSPPPSHPLRRRCRASTSLPTASPRAGSPPVPTSSFSFRSPSRRSSAVSACLPASPSTAPCSASLARRRCRCVGARPTMAASRGAPRRRPRP